MKTIDIQERMEEKRKELIELVREYGFYHDRVIVCSQELDSLVYLLMESIIYTEEASYMSEKKNTITATCLTE
ncbi:Spo0E family sporulation regulatory protein-aspartic acid phosphatase [Bacillus sp. GB_SG_008]|uniref:Spo0E family sporulation regulatory protein-aspartic acid phosphatase n=1 Tax=Bacillus sp. GB_SG_008 TaxID=3454627 RepID=UPI003F86A32D